jgi:hypothetical protein
VFTSWKDDTAGGDTNNDGPSTGTANDWGGIVVSGEGSELSGSYLTVRFAQTAISQQGGQIIVSQVLLDNDALGVDAVAGSASLRGTFTNLGYGIRACDWATGSDCFVDAAYSDWGSPDGPFPPSGALVCGSVVVRPWLPQAVGQSPFVGYCNGQPPPDQEMLSAASASDDAVGALCGGDFTDACQVYTTYKACYTAAYNLAGSQVPQYALPDATNFERATGYSGAALGILSDAYSGSTPTSIPNGVVLGGYITQVASVINTLFALRDASASCRP